MQEIVGDRLPKFTEDQVKLVKGSFDYLGINQYTSYYMYNPQVTTPPKALGYQEDWHVGFACKCFPYLHLSILHLINMIINMTKLTN